ncbi:MAG: hypothetical protein OXR66_02930 [Candidatus Woesearchaeota archaeon]|nr:hypothetical protein [Candidatus Woesearchaeota archaeon]
MKLGKLLTVMFLCFALMFSASAELVVNKYTNDFVLSTPTNEQIKMCSCEARTDTLIVENTGNFHASFDLTLHTSYPRQIKLAESSFELPPGHFREVLVYIEDSCNLEGTFEYMAEAVNSFGRVERISRSINVAPCETMQLAVAPEEVNVGLCQPAVFDVTVTNVGTFEDTFALDFGEYNDVAITQLNELQLRPGQSETQSVQFTLDCTQHGEFVIPFTVMSSKVGLGPSVERTVTVANEYSFGIDISTSMSACAETTTQVPITVENAAHVPDDVTLTMNAPAFVSFEGEHSTTVELAPQSEREVLLTVDPSRPGEYTVEVTAKDAHGDLSKTREMQLNVQHCYEPAAEWRVDEFTSVEESVTCCGKKQYFVNLQNNGEREQKLQVELNAPSFFLLEERTVTLAPQQNLNLPVTANLPCSDETYQAEVLVYPVGQEHIVASDIITIESQTQRTCHMVQVDEDEVNVREDANLIPVVVRHTGIEGGNYTITSESTLFSVVEEEIELQPGDEKSIHLQPTADLEEQEKGRYLVFPTFTLQGLGVIYDEAVGVDLNNISWFERFMQWLFSLSLAGICGCGKIVLLLLLVVLIMLLILVCAWLGLFKLRPMARATINLAKTVILVLIVLLLLALPFLQLPAAEAQYERSAQSQATVLEWYQNMPLELNLDEYFDDPDYDDLAYSATQPRDVRVTIDDNRMTLTPDHNFVGENELVVTANDLKSGTATSPAFILRVIPKKDLSCGEWICVWCKHLLIIELVLILLILFLLLLTAREKRMTREENVIVVVPKKRATRKKPAKKAVTRAKVRFYASKNGKRAHKRGCMALKKVKRSDRVTFKSRNAVKKARRSLCPMCTKRS